MSLTIKFALFTSLLCLAIIGGISFFSYNISKQKLASSIGERLEAVVRSGAVQIDGTLHDQIEGPEHASGEAFTTIQNQLRKLKAANDLKEELYTFRRVGEKVHFIVMTHNKPFIGDPYTVKKEMLPTLNEGKSNYTGIYTDTHGEWISAYAPILDRDGHISGLLEADMRVEEFLLLLKDEYQSLAVRAVTFAVIAVILSFLLASTVTRKLNYLTEVTEKISLGKMDASIEIKGRDEVSKLAASLERMRESLKIAAQLLD